MREITDKDTSLFYYCHRLYITTNEIQFFDNKMDETKSKGIGVKCLTPNLECGGPSENSKGQPE